MGGVLLRGPAEPLDVSLSRPDAGNDSETLLRAHNSHSRLSFFLSILELSEENKQSLVCLFLCTIPWKLSDVAAVPHSRGKAGRCSHPAVH